MIFGVFSFSPVLSWHTWVVPHPSGLSSHRSARASPPVWSPWCSCTGQSCPPCSRRGPGWCVRVWWPRGRHRRRRRRSWSRTGTRSRQPRTTRPGSPPDCGRARTWTWPRPQQRTSGHCTAGGGGTGGSSYRRQPRTGEESARTRPG